MVKRVLCIFFFSAHCDLAFLTQKTYISWHPLIKKKIQNKTQKMDSVDLSKKIKIITQIHHSHFKREDLRESYIIYNTHNYQHKEPVMKFFLLFLVIVLPVSTRKLSDPVASLMNVQDPDVEDRRRFRFQNEEQKKTVFCPKNLRCGEECLWNGKKGPVRVVPKGGCCPSEGWTGTPCNGHGHD